MMPGKKIFGGQAGVAEDALRGRQEQIDRKIREAEGGTEPPKESPNRQPDNSDGAQRPPPSKKWYQ